MDAADAERVLVVDDQPSNVAVVSDYLAFHGYRVEAAANGEQALALVQRNPPDVLLLDVMMPGKSGYDVCRELRAQSRYAALPIVLMTALDDTDRKTGLQAGADEFLTKPVVREELLARVARLITIKRLYERVEDMNRNLQALVDEKVREIDRLSKLRRFLAPRLAERVVSGEADDPWRLHRRDIVVVFFDLRGFTAFSEVNAPEDIMGVLREFHAKVGEQTIRHGGTIERFAGDGIMVFFNDPEPVANPCEQAVRFVMAAMDGCRPLLERWRRSGFEIDVAAAAAYGYATLGAIGFEDRMDYGAIGPVTNLASRLCGEAAGGEVLLSSRVAAQLPADIAHEPAGLHSLKGFRAPVECFRLLRGS
jgi:class 3 adenylate cyclase/CheY-like chemotaxis protein